MKGYVRENTQQISAGYSAPRKCRNAVSAGVLSPISSAVGRNGAVGDKRNARAGARNSPVGDKYYAYAAARRRLIRHGFAVPPISLRVGRSADLTRHRRVIQHREPLKGKANGGVSFNTADPQGEGLSLCGLGTRLPVTSSGGRLTPADGRGDEDRMEVGSENTWKKEWNSCR